MKFKNLLVYLIIVLVLTILYVPRVYETIDTSKNFVYSGIALFSIVVYLVAFRRLYKSWVRFEPMFLLGFIIVHFQVPYLFSIGIDPGRPELVWLNKDVVNYATWLSSVTIHLWMIGSVISTLRDIRKTTLKISPSYTYNVKKLDLILIISFLGFFGLAGGALLSGSHDGMGSWGEGASYFMILLRVCLYFRVYIFFKFLKKLTIVNIIKGNFWFLSILLIYLFTFLLIGDRGPFLQMVLVIMLCYGIFIHRIKFTSLVALVVVGSLLLTIIGLGRSLEDGNMFESGYSKFQNSESNPTDELASSVRIMYRAITYFPEQIDYLYGLQFLIGILGIVPFASGLFITAFGIPTELTASSRMFTYIGQGNNVTYGEGTEIVSDIFINFGIYGVFIIMFLYGYFTSKVSFNAIKKHSDKYFLILLVITSTAIYINRAQFLMPLRDIIYILVIFRIVRKQTRFNNNQVNES